MKKIGILYICTGKYTIFWEGFYQSAEKFLLPELEKHYFVFTDGEINTYGNPFVKIIEQEKLGWPFDTLYRFNMFLKIENQLQEMDYLFFFNSNLVIMQAIGNEILPSEQDELVVTQHPGFFNKERRKFTYETNKKSTAYIAKNEGQVYIAGGLNGGTTQNFLKLAKTLSQNIDIDYKKGIIALWHDESHINRYIIGKNVKILPPSYLYKQDSNIPFEQKILILNKDDFGGHDFLRQIPQKRSAIKTLPLMISIVICNKNKEVLPELCHNIEKTIKVEHEIIVIDNSLNKHSIFEAYNIGVKQCINPIICFIHDDLIFHTEGWGEKIVNHFLNPDTGMIGISGPRYISKIPGIWWGIETGNNNAICQNCINTDRNNLSKSHKVLIQPYQSLEIEVVALDGLFFCIRKELFEKISFDEISYKGFHFYDLDISMQVKSCGYKLYCIYDVLMEHISASKLDKEWVSAARIFFNKWKDSLPISAYSIPPKDRKKMEFNNFKIMTKLLRQNKLKRCSFFTKEELLYSYNNMIFTFSLR